MKNKSLVYGLVGAVVGGGIGAGVTYYIMNKRVKDLTEELNDAYDYIEEAKEYDVRNSDLYVHGGTIELAEGEDGTDAINAAKEKLKANWEGKVAYSKRFNSTIWEGNVDDGAEMVTSEDTKEHDDSDEDDSEEDEDPGPDDDEFEYTEDDILKKHNVKPWQSEGMSFPVEVEAVGEQYFLAFCDDWTDLYVPRDRAQFDTGLGPEEYERIYVEYFESSRRFRNSEPDSVQDHYEIPNDGYAFGNIIFDSGWDVLEEENLYIINHTLRKCYHIRKMSYEVEDNYDVDESSLEHHEEDGFLMYEGGYLRHCEYNYERE